MFDPTRAVSLCSWRYLLLPLLMALMAVSIFSSGPFCHASEPGSQTEADEFVATKVRPLLKARCFECHGPEDQRTEEELAGNLQLISRKAMLAGGDTGPAIVPGQPEKSLLIKAVEWDELEMPPDNKLPNGEIAILKKWIAMGAPWPEGEDHAVTKKDAFPLEQRRASHWAWQPLASPQPPEVADAEWPRRPLDRFVAVARQEKNLPHATDADRRTLIRRMSFAIIGLPPTPEEVAAFVSDPAPDDEAIATLADRLLASPHYGERWGRHWLDLMRYAESRGHEFDFDAANAWHYRDYVIRALNDDLPYNKFLVEHIAGDLLQTPRLRGKEGANESILATGFWYLGDWVHSPTDIRADETDRIDNQLDVFGRAMLGVTVACARCHDHKFDAISSADYYALAGYLQSSSYRQVRFEAMEHNRNVARRLWELRQRTTDQLRKELGEPLQAGVQGVARYLLAANEAIRTQCDVKQLAAQQQLDPVRLEAWIKYLETAKAKPDDWLHGWSMLPEQPSSPDHFGKVWESFFQQQKTEVATYASNNEQSKLIFDFSAYLPSDWRQDGYAFGPGPVLAGDTIVSGNAANPQIEVAARGALRQDLEWPALTLSRGTTQEAGKLDLNRAGRTFRSQTFTLDQGFHYLVRGKGKFQLVVASHRLINGPLHGSLVQNFDTKGQLQWLSVDCRRYAGLRAHLEFFAQPGQQCEVYKVVSGKKPALPIDPLKETVAWIAEEREITNESLLAAAIEQRLADVVGRFVENKISRTDHTNSAAGLVAWLLEHPALVGDALGASQVQQTLARFYPQQAAILADVRRESATAIAMMDGDGEDENLLIRGSSKSPGPRVPRRFLAALGGVGPPDSEHGSGRLHLAQQIVDPARNPLVSRVIVNRVWHHLIGRGIVPTVDNFGVLGEPPSHPELLDYLAQQFISEGWSLKKLVREIVSSRTYRMASQPVAASVEELDPENIYLHRMSIKRLEGEAIRDAILAISGRLDRNIGGQSVPVHLTSHMTGRGRPKGGPLDGQGRRSIYLAIRRNFLPPMLLAFDMPIPSNPVGRRNVSNVPAQPLTLMNDPFVVQQAKQWADIALKTIKTDPAQRIDWMYQNAFGRGAREAELEAGLDFLKAQGDEYKLTKDQWQNDPRVWADYAHVLWNVKEFIFIQ
jgi:cytochrome c553